VYLYVDGKEVKFSDNYFDLIPGEAKTVTVLNDIKISKIIGLIQVISLYDSY
jgi:Ig-fold domain